MNDLVISTIDNEPRVLDVALAEQLGFTNPPMIRRIIKDHAEELAAFGVISVRETTPGPLGGRPGQEFHLNRQQTLLVCILSRTERAKEVRAEVIWRFDAYQQLVQDTRPQLPGDYLSALKALVVSEEAKQEARAQIEALKPMALIGERAADRKRTLHQEAKRLDGVNLNALPKRLADLNVLFKRDNGAYSPYAKYRDSHFIVRDSEERGSVTLVVTAKGKVLLEDLYRKGLLPMKKGCSPVRLAA